MAVHTASDVLKKITVNQVYKILSYLKDNPNPSEASFTGLFHSNP